MREWLSGGAPPCQGGGRGFDPRLALSKITKRTSEWEVLFCYSRSAGHFSKPNCLAVWVRFLGTLKRPSVVPEPRSTGPCGTRLALSKITKRTSEWEVLFCYPRSAGHFSKPNCLAVWVRFLGELKRSSVVPEPRSTGPCGTRLALSKITKGTYFTSPRRNSRVFCELCSQKTPRGMLPVNQWYLDNANNT